jgi:proton glutamate symport protein
MLNNELITHSEKFLKNLNNISQSNNIIEYIENMMPTNIIRAIHERKDISILIFSILLGIALGVTKHPNVFTAIAFFDAIFLAFMKIVNLLMYALPIGIFFLISGFISNIGLQTLKELFDLIGLIYAIVLFMFFLFSFIIAKKKKTTMINSLKILKNPYLIAFGTSSSFASMPAAMLALSKDFSAHAQSVEIVMPLGVNLFKPGIMIRNITVAFFLMNLYNIPITPNALFSLFFGSWFASLAGSAGPAILSASTFSIVLSPLGIPPAVGIFLLMSIEPLIDPMISALNIQSNCAVTLLVAKQESS